MSSKDAWDTLRICWIDNYTGPPEYITYDARRNFIGPDFRQSARIMGTYTKEVLVEAYNLIGLVEHYHLLLYRAYKTIKYNL